MFTIHYASISLPDHKLFAAGAGNGGVPVSVITVAQPNRHLPVVTYLFSVKYLAARFEDQMIIAAAITNKPTATVVSGGSRRLGLVVVSQSE